MPQNHRPQGPPAKHAELYNTTLNAAGLPPDIVLRRKRDGDGNDNKGNNLARTSRAGGAGG